MIYLGSYFEPKNHHGQLISISRSKPKGFKVDGDLDFFKPTKALLDEYKGGDLSWSKYTQIYKETTIQPHFNFIKDWIKRLNKEEDITLLCWEKARENCHRNLVGTLCNYLRPDVVGGADTPYSPGDAVEGFVFGHWQKFAWIRKDITGRHVLQYEDGRELSLGPFVIRPREMC